MEQLPSLLNLQQDHALGHRAPPTGNPGPEQNDPTFPDDTAPPTEPSPTTGTGADNAASASTAMVPLPPVSSDHINLLITIIILLSLCLIILLSKNCKGLLLKLSDYFKRLNALISTMSGRSSSESDDETTLYEVLDHTVHLD